MQEKAKSFIPGMTQLLSKRPDRFSMGVWPTYFRKAKGAYIWDLDGNRYLDMSIGGIGANILGYADPDVDNAVIGAIRNGTSSSLNCPEEIELAELLCQLHPWAQMVRYARTGGEALAIAVRIARAFTQKDKVAFCGYHGWHDWYLAANLGTEDALGAHLISGLSPIGVPEGLRNTAFPFRYNHIDELKGIIKNHGRELAAIIMEPIRNFEPEPGFFENVRALSNEVGAVLIVDEISAGFRLATGGAHMVLFDESPDIAVFSKALGNGYPISAVIGKKSIMQAAQSTFISSTNWTERVGPAAAIATIRKHRKFDVHKHLMALGEKIQQGWLKFAHQYDLPIRVSGISPMRHFVFEAKKKRVMKAYFIQSMLEKGFLASTLFYAMYAHTPDHVKHYLEALDKVFSELQEALGRGTLNSQLVGLPSEVGFQRLN
ncbi:MAG: aminotransferase class III-fold pyridoxal phosphate-dependent enzyme [Desulfobacterales bacterium]|jgi:glutamate-1-semialdehyde 2,1-aminomutase|nr:aminotransferase class III-fold pyridoxal phosphate-dependent enzyme [Desulfobacterales bacterium]MDP6808716.1 aminotransferase class III-fold pyridoxal phosphate-dependent enzyme [Desulfobacterales bacterium]|tara:strand:+ start:3346 stop:4641 length:1296 start_codon:yes stop_codon:yes gene_type:complete